MYNCHLEKYDFSRLPHLGTNSFGVERCPVCVRLGVQRKLFSQLRGSRSLTRGRNSNSKVNFGCKGTDTNYFATQTLFEQGLLCLTMQWSTCKKNISFSNSIFLLGPKFAAVTFLPFVAGGRPRVFVLLQSSTLCQFFHNLNCWDFLNAAGARLSSIVGDVKKGAGR